MEKEKIFFKAGDIVRIKQDIDAPNMVIKHINKAILKDDENTPTNKMLIGITCFWFTKEHAYQVQLFSTKDLVLVK